MVHMHIYDSHADQGQAVDYGVQIMEELGVEGEAIGVNSCVRIYSLLFTMHESVNWY